MDAVQPCASYPEQTTDMVPDDVAITIQFIHTNYVLGQFLPGACQNAYSDLMFKPSCQAATISNVMLNLTNAELAAVNELINSPLLAGLSIDPVTGLLNVLAAIANAGANVASILLATALKLFFALQCTHQYAYELVIWTNLQSQVCLAYQCPSLLQLLLTLQQPGPNNLRIGVFCDRRCYPNITHALPTNPQAPYCTYPPNTSWLRTTCFIQKGVTPILAALSPTCTV